MERQFKLPDHHQAERRDQEQDSQRPIPLDRKDAESQHRIFDFLAITAQLANGCRNEHFRTSAHDGSMLCKAVGEANKSLKNC
jgi:hypothetical protein